MNLDAMKVNAYNAAMNREKRLFRVQLRNDQGARVNGRITDGTVNCAETRYEANLTFR